ncbi:hypothetical protein ASC80_12285 [Afipia sp. Root123D2]|uniref:DUF5943 domain-containing protein n=1 Tax=Afipia sp. Root123D2 TaxID=1736436 RepID=UPI00070119F9|nr:DUF5943 domain-containing protein [Afipia sp. Root123D2]KQW20937.1 hypothetical protein ASC80_12285 [Afipia sp. Root123D2]
MASFEPAVPIRVDPETGIWTTDGLPMIYLPRHFYLNHIAAFTKALGEGPALRVLYEAGYESAWQWCEKEAAQHNLHGADVFLHYMKRISQRGWGQFTVLELNRSTGETRVQLDHSVFVAGHSGLEKQSVCSGFAGWFAGALEWVGHSMGFNWKLKATEDECAGDGQHGHCIFWIRPSNEIGIYHRVAIK